MTDMRADKPDKVCDDVENESQGIANEQFTSKAGGPAGKQNVRFCPVFAIVIDRIFAV